MQQPLLSLEALSKSYWRGPHEVKVLREVSLEVRQGELVAVWGSRGSGKTTLLKLATGTERPDRGHVRVEGRDLEALSETKRARLMRERIGWARRSGPRSELCVLDHVALPLLATHAHRAAYERAREALQRVGVPECARQPWQSLSDGERALVTIARGIVRRPRLLLVDDPTTNLDVGERETVLQLLAELVQELGFGALLTVPDAPELMIAQRMLMLSGGRLLAPPEPGPPARVIALRAPGRSA
jgi:ABC-type lipoprotein export system ATPase subunit